MNITNHAQRLKSLILNKKKILIVSGKNSYFKSKSNIFINKILKKNNKHYYFKYSPYPDLREIKIVAKKISKISPDILIAIGGGSVMDLAKISNVLNIKKKIHKKYKVNSKKKTKLIAIPLTSGSGAEVTSSAVMYVNKKKISIETNKIKPDYFFLIPHLIKNSPKKIKGPAIFDCISQAIESIFSLKSDKKSIYYAVKSLKISLKYYFKYYKKPTLDNCEKMLIASNYAGMAINISRTIASHAMSYPFTSMFHISHGSAVAINFINILRYNYFNQSKSVSKFSIKKRFRLLFKLTKVENLDQLTNYLKKIIINLKVLPIINNIEFLNSLPKIKKGISEKRLSNNPVKINSIDIKKILQNSIKKKLIYS